MPPALSEKLLCLYVISKERIVQVKWRSCNKVKIEPTALNYDVRINLLNWKRLLNKSQ
jgi:hypothetical protein